MPELAGTIGTLEGEILVAKIQLDRALAEWQRWPREGDCDCLDPEPEAESPSMVAGVALSQSEKGVMQRQRPDLHALIDRCLSRIGRLEQQQTTIQEEDEDDLGKDPVQMARVFRAMMVEMEAATGIEPGMGLYRGRAAMLDDDDG